MPVAGFSFPGSVGCFREGPGPGAAVSRQGRHAHDWTNGEAARIEASRLQAPIRRAGCLLRSAGLAITRAGCAIFIRHDWRDTRRGARLPLCRVCGGSCYKVDWRCPASYPLFMFRRAPSTRSSRRLESPKPTWRVLPPYPGFGWFHLSTQPLLPRCLQQYGHGRRNDCDEYGGQLPHRYAPG